MFRLTTLALVVVLAASMATAQVGQTADPVDCSNFTYKEDAQAYFDSHPGDPGNLDDDNDGLACEHLPNRPAPAPAPAPGPSTGNDTQGAASPLGNPQPVGTFYTAPTSAPPPLSCPASNLPQCFTMTSPITIGPSVGPQQPLSIASAPAPPPLSAPLSSAPAPRPVTQDPSVLGGVSIRPPSTGDGGLR